MTRENAPTKARRLLTEGRVVVTRIDTYRIDAQVRGDSAALYRVAYLGGQWHCTCPARTRCSHVQATQSGDRCPSTQGGAMTDAYGWSETVDRAGHWTDRLVSQWDGKAVFVTRAVVDELGSEYMRLVFPDGTNLFLGVHCGAVAEHLPPETSGLADCSSAAYDSDAYRAFGAFVGPLYEGASVAEVQEGP